MIEIKEFTEWRNNVIGRHFQAVNAKEEMFYFHHSFYTGLRCIPENLSGIVGGRDGSRLVLFAHDSGYIDNPGFIKVFPCKTDAMNSLEIIRDLIWDYMEDEKLNDKVERIPGMLNYFRKNDFLLVKGFTRLTNHKMAWNH